MARPERPLDPAAGPIQAFAAALRDLRDQAGQPKYLQMARATGKSRTALTEAAGGDHLATWDTVEAYVRACGANPNEWRQRWEQVRDEVRPTSTSFVNESTRPPPAEAQPATEDPELAAAGAHSPRRRLLLAIAVTAVVAAAVTAFVLHNAGEDDDPTTQPEAVTEKTVVVQNKVAFGSTRLTEDTTPAYLSTRPIPFCGRNGCKLPGTEMWSDAVIVVTCWTKGSQMSNADETSAGIADNPHRVVSDRWYRVLFPDGRAGYLSEVYIAPKYRGGVGLRQCPPQP